MRVMDSYNLRITLEPGYILIATRVENSVTTIKEPFTRLEMLQFADQLQDAATAIRDTIAAEDPALLLDYQPARGDA